MPTSPRHLVLSPSHSLKGFSFVQPIHQTAFSHLEPQVHVHEPLVHVHHHHSKHHDPKTCVYCSKKKPQPQKPEKPKECEECKRLKSIITALELKNKNLGLDNSSLTKRIALLEGQIQGSLKYRKLYEEV